MDNALELGAESFAETTTTGLGLTQPRVSVIVPTLNEEANLRHVLPRIPSWVHEIIIVDGRSTDNTVEVARTLRPGAVIVYEDKAGKGAALVAGFLAASGDIVATVDADGSNDPGELHAFVGALMAGADYAKGSRFLQGGGTEDMTRLRRAGNWVFIKMVQIGFGGRYTDLCYGYNAFWKDHLPTLAPDGDGFEIETILNIRALRGGLNVVEIASNEALRIHGSSNLRTFRDGWRVLKTIGRERFRSREVVDLRFEHSISSAAHQDAKVG